MADLLLRRSAVISDDGRYRYELRRAWDISAPPFVLGMLNPSTADAEIDDPTIIRGMSRAQRLGCGSLIVWNLGAGRATDPADWKAMPDPIGPENWSWVRNALEECEARSGTAVVAWGAHGSFLDLDKRALAIAEAVGVTLHCLGRTAAGQPRHPLYIRNDQPLEPYRP
jgi:hypothetical protein